MMPGIAVPNDEKRKKELTRLLRQSAKLRKQSDHLAAEAKRLRGEIATSTDGRVVERRKKQRLKGK
jgi:cell division protein FtsB